MIKNVLICGLGAIGTYYAYKISQNSNYNLKILLDEERYERYSLKKRYYNGIQMNFDYILPDYREFKPDLIIISVKSYSLNQVIDNIKNFVADDTIILSFLNGITSEDCIYDKYAENKGIYSYILGHTFFRNINNTTHDGISKVYFGSIKPNDIRVKQLEEFFRACDVNYSVEDDIIASMWGKFVFNCCVNQISAVTGFSFEQIKNSAKCSEMMINVANEVSAIAKKLNVNSYNKFNEIVFNSLNMMCPEGKSSMLQDIEAGRRTEIDIFGKTVVKLGEKYDIYTPYNKILSEIIELLHFNTSDVNNVEQ